MSRLAGLVLVLALVGAGCSTDTPEPTASTATVTTATVVTTTTTTTATTILPTITTTTALPTVAGTSTIELVVGETARSYRLSVPSGLVESVPLVVDLHGLSATPETQDELSAMSLKGQDEGFVVAQPLGLGALPSWSAGDNAVADEDVAFLVSLVADVSTRVPIDASRIYASGFSNGGGMANRLACNAAETFAAIGTVAGAYIEHLECEPTRPVPVIAFHGTRDFVVPYEGLLGLVPDVEDWWSAWGSRNDCGEAVESQPADDVVLVEWTGCADGADVLLYRIDGGGHGWPGTASTSRLLNSTQSISATDLVWEFFAAHPLGDGA